MSRSKKRIDTSGGDGLAADNPFGALSGAGLPDAPATPEPSPGAAGSRAERRRAAKSGPLPRLDLRRLKAGKGGKTVTEISGFIGVSAADLDRMAKDLKARCGVGGAVKSGAIEIQGDKRDVLKPLLEERGYRVVLSGG